MNISDNGLNLIKQFEGFIPTPYMCPADKLTIGYGHVIKPDETFTKITEQQATEILRQDCSYAVLCVDNNVYSKLNQNQFDALVSFVFNVGCSAFKNSTLRRLLNAQEFELAAAEFDKWVYAKRIKLNGLVARRNAEKALFTKED